MAKIIGKVNQFKKGIVPTTHEMSKVQTGKSKNGLTEIDEAAW